MNGKIVFLTLIVTFLLFVSIVEASATTRTVGVNVGDKFSYSTIISWNSTDPSANPPSDLEDFNNTLGDVTVMGISGTNITVQSTTDYGNGTAVTMGGWKDVDTGAANMSLLPIIVSANLTAGDSVYSSLTYTSWIINETVSRTYLGVARDTNHLNFPPSPNTLNVSYDFYLDKSTGVLVEELAGSINHTGAYTTMWSEDFQLISSTGTWAVPEFPAWTSLLLMLVAVMSATIVITRQRQHKRNFH